VEGRKRASGLSISLRLPESVNLLLIIKKWDAPGYHPEAIQTALEQIHPEIMTKIQFEISAKLSKAEKAAQGKSGFVPVAVRWVIERSNSWVERCNNSPDSLMREKVIE
jgi:Transposase DDE domain